MHSRFAALLSAALLALAVTGSARAADLRLDVAVPMTGVGCGCGDDMITVYDFQPGVVKRHWKDCDCGAPPPRPRPVSGLPAFGPQFEPIVEPWRR